MIKKDLTGKRFHKLTVLREVEPLDIDDKLKYRWLVGCECGGTKIVPHQSVLQEKVKSCGCEFARKPSKYNTGDRYAMLTIVEEGVRSNKGKRQVWCSCDCGNLELTLVQTNNLVSGNTSSCGCVGEASRKTHGMSNTRTYQIHEGMLRRCNCPQQLGYENYGGRGINVAANWVSDFGRFLADMGLAPTTEHTLDRLDVNKGYYAENCRWATRTQQMRNTRLTTMYNGEPLADIADREGVNRKTASRRVSEGQDPINPIRKNKKWVGIAEASRETGIPYSTLANRMKRNGLTLKEAKRGTKK